MGKRNRQRRADKRRRADNKRESNRSGSARHDRSSPDEPSIDELVSAAAMASREGDGEVTDALVDHIVQLVGFRGRATELEMTLFRRLTEAVAGRWTDGWQPADLAHVVSREFRAVHRQVCTDVIAIESADYRHSPGADQTWLAQLDAVCGDQEHRQSLGRWMRAAGGLREALLVAVQTLGLLWALPTLPKLIPPPSDWGESPLAKQASAVGDPKMAERVRSLLAKAESTSYPDEAEAFTAKAQELIARHAIDQAMLEAADEQGDRQEVVRRRILLDDPYARPKSMLASRIAEANHCTAVYTQSFGFVTVFGMSNDVDAVELLFASLLTQATAAMAAAGRAGGAKTRARSFRQSFLVAYAGRIGERLQEATRSAVDDAREDHGDSVLPVLASREAAADEARSEVFPHIKLGHVSLNNYEGYVAGQAAADMAQLGPDVALRAG